MQDFRVIGNIGSDLALQETANGVAMLNFSVAVKRDYTNADGERGVDWFDCRAYRGLAGAIAKWCKKGDKIYLAGRLETRSYEDIQGVKRKAINFIIDKMEFLDNKKEHSESNEEEPTTTKRKATLTSMEGDDCDPPF